jgi:hypothetical protein
MAGFELARSRPLVGLPTQEEPDQWVRRGRGVRPTFGCGSAALWGRRCLGTCKIPRTKPLVWWWQHKNKIERKCIRRDGEAIEYL